MELNRVVIPPEDLRKMQMIELEILLEIDRICKKHNIKYCIIAGTLLGAVRHKGFIPWDDDADVAMLRPEYEKFREVCEKELDKERFFFQDYKNTKEYRWGYGKVRRVGTELVRSGQEHMKFKTGVFVDVFPLDNVPDNYMVRKIHNGVCTIIRKLQWSKAGYKCEKSKVKRLLFLCLSKIPKRFIYLLYNLLVKVSNKKETKMVRILTFPTPNNGYYGYYKKWYEEVEDIEFEGYYFPGIKDYDEYLTFKFGNYMKFPPEDQRKGHMYSRYKI